MFCINLVNNGPVLFEFLKILFPLGVERRFIL